MASPRRLGEEGLGSPVREFTANAACAVVRADSGIDRTSLTDAPLNPTTRFGACTPVAGPPGDYTEDHKTHPGAKKTLDDKAQLLIGGRGPSPVPQGKDATAWYLIDGQQIDVMPTCRSGAESTVRRESDVRVVLAAWRAGGSRVLRLHDRRLHDRRLHDRHWRESEDRRLCPLSRI